MKRSWRKGLAFALAVAMTATMLPTNSAVKAAETYSSDTLVTVMDNMYDEAMEFKDGFLLVQNGDFKEDTIMTKETTLSYVNSKGVATTLKNQDSEGNVLFDKLYIGISCVQYRGEGTEVCYSNVTQGILVVGKNDKLGLMGIDGTLFGNSYYDNVRIINDKSFLSKTGNRWTLRKKDGTIIQKFAANAIPYSLDHRESDMFALGVLSDGEGYCYLCKADGTLITTISLGTCSFMTVDLTQGFLHIYGEIETGSGSVYHDWIYTTGGKKILDEDESGYKNFSRLSQYGYAPWNGGIINTSGKYVVPKNTFKYAPAFTSDRALIYREDGTTQLISMDNKVELDVEEFIATQKLNYSSLSYEAYYVDSQLYLSVFDKSSYQYPITEEGSDSENELDMIQEDSEVETEEDNTEEATTEATSEEMTEEDSTEATSEDATEETEIEVTSEEITEETGTEATSESATEETSTEATSEEVTEEAGTEATSEDTAEENSTEPENEETGVEEENIQNDGAIATYSKAITYVFDKNGNKLRSHNGMYVPADYSYSQAGYYIVDNTTESNLYKTDGTKLYSCEDKMFLFDPENSDIVAQVCHYIYLRETTPSGSTHINKRYTGSQYVLKSGELVEDGIIFGSIKKCDFVDEHWDDDILYGNYYIYSLMDSSEKGVISQDGQVIVNAGEYTDFKFFSKSEYFTGVKNDTCYVLDSAGRPVKSSVNYNTVGAYTTSGFGADNYHVYDYSNGITSTNLALTTKTVDGKQKVGIVRIQASIAATKLSSITSASYNSVTLNWNKSKNATGYEIYRSTSKTGTYRKIKTITNAGTLSCKDTGLICGKTYYYKIRSYYKINGNNTYSSYSAVVSGKSQPAKATFSSVQATSTTSTQLKWKVVSGASGYEIYRSTSKNSGYSRVTTINSGTTTSYNNKGLTGNKTYYYRVRAYRTVDGNKIYGSFSNTTSVRTYSNTEAFVARIYTQALGRQPEVAGLAYWTGEINKGARTPVAVAEAFILSPEFTNKKLNNTEYVDVLYRTFMGRKADKGGLNYWVGRLNAGESRKTVLESFAGCQEFKDIVKGFGL